MFFLFPPRFLVILSYKFLGAVILFFLKKKIGLMMAYFNKGRPPNTVLTDIFNGLSLLMLCILSS